MSFGRASSIFICVRILGLGEAAAPAEHRRAARPPPPARPHPYPGEWGLGGPGGRGETNGTPRGLPDIGHRMRPKASCPVEINVTRPWRWADALPGGQREGHTSRLAARRGRAAPGAHQRLPSNPRAFPQLRPFPARPAPAPAGPPGSGKEPQPWSAPGGRVRAWASPFVSRPSFGRVLGKGLRGAWRVAEGPPLLPPRTSRARRPHLPRLSSGTPVPWAPRAPSVTAPTSSHLHFCALGGRGQTGKWRKECGLCSGRAPHLRFSYLRGETGLGRGSSVARTLGCFAPWVPPRGRSGFMTGVTHGGGGSLEGMSGLRPVQACPRRASSHAGF